MRIGNCLFYLPAVLAVGLVQAGFGVSLARAQNGAILTGHVSSVEEGLMEGVVIGAKKDGATITVAGCVAPRSTIFLRSVWIRLSGPHRSMRMHGHLRGSDNEAGIVRGLLGLRCLFAAVSFAVHARSNGVRRRSRGRLKCDPLGAHEPFDEPRSIIDYLRTKRPRSRNEHPTNCG